MKRCLQFLFPILFLVTVVTAQQPADESMERFGRGNFDQPTLIEVLPKLADPKLRASIRGTLLEAKKPPFQDLVALLGHPMLAVRLGSLEILEEAAGGDLRYNPWAPAESTENAAALERWRTWAKEPTKPGKQGLFTDEQRRGYLQDILGDEADKAVRARRMLEAEGLSAVGFLETFLRDTPTLSSGYRARVREAQYQITLSKQLGDQAATVARELAFGSRDQILSALTSVREAGLLAMPILRDFISHSDPLVRESAIDSLLVTGGETAVSIIAPILQKEPDVNVIHGAMRRLKDVPGDETVALVASFLSHPDEDLLISAIQTSLTLAGSDSDSSFGSKSKPATPADAEVVKALADRRWRVRAAALEYVAKRRVTTASSASLKLLEDPDEFVRFAAIKAISALGSKEALPKLKEMFLKDEAMAGPVVEGYGALNQPLDDEILKRLDLIYTDAKLAALRATESNKSLVSLILKFAADPNADVSSAALRLIAGNEDLMKQDRYASVVLTALRGKDTNRTEAILERLDLPKSEKTDPRLDRLLASPVSGPTTLDPMYEVFLQGAGEGPPVSAGPVIAEVQAELAAEISRLTSPERSAATRYRAALILATASYPEGFITLLELLPHLTTAEKTAITEGIDEPSVAEAIPLLTRLLQDPIPEIRSSAAYAALSNDHSPAISNSVFAELARPGALLQPDEVYSYRYESALRSGKAKNMIREWAIGVLDNAGSPSPMKVLAMVSLRSLPSPATLRALENYRKSPDPILRRAAWNAVFMLKPTEIRTSGPSVLADDQAFVRMTVLNSMSSEENSWSHHFSDLKVITDQRWSYGETKPVLPETLKQTVLNLATTDPSPLVRFEAGFCLLRQNANPDIAAFAALIPQLPKETRARDRISSWLSEMAERATPGLRPLLAVADPSHIRPAKMKILNARINPTAKGGFSTFESLATAAAEAATPAGTLLTEEKPPVAPVMRQSLEVIVFYKPGCPECARTKEYLKAMAADFPQLRIQEHNILESAGTVLNQALCQRFAVPSAQQTLSPAVFTQAGFVIRDTITPQSLAALFSKTMATAQDDSWMNFDQQQKTEAGKEVDNRYAAFTLPIVLGAGLLDGINPCAFATIIFFLSYLQIARRTPREMLMVGAAFIVAVFLAYLAAGLVLYQFLAALNAHFSGIQWWMNLGFAALALLAAALSFRDAWRARGGRLDEMTLQLPAFLKNRIRGVIRDSTRSRNFVIAAFISGIVISLLELACTGQVYAPIIYQIQQGRLNAVAWLVVYNLAFIAPLIVIFLLAYSGLRSETLVSFQKKHTSAVKIGLGLLFLVLAVFILFGQRWLA